MEVEISDCICVRVSTLLPQRNENKSSMRVNKSGLEIRSDTNEITR